jgi:hypothetical protein
MSVQPYQSKGSLIDFNVYKPEYIGRPVEQLQKMVQLQAANNKQILDKTSAIDLALSNLDVNPEDEGAKAAIANQRQAINDRINSIISSGDYTLAEAQANRMARDFTTDKGLQQSVANQAIYNKHRELAEKLYHNNKISYGEYLHGMNQPVPDTKLDDKTGTYTQYSPDEIMNKFDYDSAYSKYVNTFIPNTILTPSGYVREVVRDTAGNIMYDNNHQPLTHIVGYGSEFKKKYDTDKLREGLRQITKNNPDLAKFVEREGGFKGKDFKTYTDELIEPYVQSKSGIDSRSDYTMYKPPATVYNAGLSNGINPNSNDEYVTDAFNGYQTSVFNANDELNKLAYLDNKSHTKISGGTGHATVNKVNDFDTEVSKLSREGKMAYNIANTVANNTYGTSFKQLTPEKRREIIENISKINEHGDAYEHIVGVQYADKLTADERKYGFLTKDDKTKELFGTVKLTPDKTGHYTYSGNINQGVIINPKTGEIYDGNFMQKLQDGEITVIDKDGNEQVLGGTDPKKRQTLALKVMSPINPTNSLTMLYDDPRFSDGYVLQIDGNDFIWSPNNNTNPNKVFSNMKYNSAKFESQIGLGTVADELGLHANSSNLTNEDINNAMFTAYYDTTDLNERGYPKLKYEINFVDSNGKYYMNIPAKMEIEKQLAKYNK